MVCEGLGGGSPAANLFDLAYAALACAHVHMIICMHVRIYMQVYMYRNVHVHMHMYMYRHMQLYMDSYMYIER